MKNNNVLICVCILFLLIIFSVLYFDIRYNLFNNFTTKIDTIEVSKTDTIYNIDTFNLVKLVPEYIEVIKTDTVYDKEDNPIELITENKIYQDTICAKGDTILLENYISGINARLDSTRATLKKSEVIKTNTITITKEIERKKRFIDRFHIAPNISAGYGMFNKQPDVYVGIGVSFDLSH